MKPTVALVTAAALLGSAISFAQMPPPPPGAAGPEGPSMERREMRRIIIRGEDGPMGMHRMPGGHGGGVLGALGLDPRPIERMVNSLGLTPQQQGKVTEIVATVRPEMRKLSQDIAAESRRLRELDPSDAKYAAQSAEIARKMGDMSARLAQQSADLRAKVWQVLTPEQRTKADSMRDRMRDRMKEMQERMNDRRGGSERPRAFVFEEVDELT
jgi:Spy/CpxP family protein refolding chaperone